MNLPFGVACLSLVIFASTAAAQGPDEPIDEIVVAGHTISTDKVDIAVDQELLVDTAVALKNLPGANVNSNGMLTGIAQYRGMYGDRVAVTIDNHSIISGGPNVMDAPLSYVSPMITEALTLERGIASVSSGPETIGGHVNARIARGDFGEAQFGANGMLGSRYSDNGDLATIAGRLTLSDASHRASFIAEHDNGHNVDTPAGDIRPSMLDRRRYDASYAYTNGEDHFALFVGKLDTEDSGTPALPMDIRYIDTSLAGTHFLYQASDRFKLEGALSVNEVNHGMDNFTLRGAPMPMAFRQNHAQGEGTTARLAGSFEFTNSSLEIGANANRGKHDSVITNPNNAAFRVENFVDVRRDLAALFAEWSIRMASSEIELGLASKHVNTEAGKVSISGMPVAAPGMLANVFNNSDRKLSFSDLDTVVKLRRRTDKNLMWSVELARKSRAPSYQELYLWLPLQASGGLADGRSYVGGLNLESERSTEINIGVTAVVGRLHLSPQVFFKSVDGFIQGVPAIDATANMVSMMMTGLPALQFANTDAEIFGADIAWNMELSGGFRLDGVVSYARGKRTDVADNLYRLAPPNASIGLAYASTSWSADARLIAYATQSNVAVFNSEKKSSAYELLDLGFSWLATESLRIEGQVRNAFDIRYQDHLAGVNRAALSDIAVGERIFGAGRTITAGLVYTF